MNLPSLSKYLGNHFPNIPQAWHMPIVISAFTAAQKVAATHGDAVICDDEARYTRKKIVGTLDSWTQCDRAYLYGKDDFRQPEFQGFVIID